MKYSHILSIQIWSEKLNDTSNYANILTKVKNQIISNTYSYELLLNETLEIINVKWELINWNKLNKSLYLGDIGTVMPEISDKLLYTHTKYMLEEITKSFDIFNSDHKIIFGIVKPIESIDLVILNNNKKIVLEQETKNKIESKIVIESNLNNEL